MLDATDSRNIQDRYSDLLIYDFPKKPFYNELTLGLLIFTS